MSVGYRFVICAALLTSLRAEDPRARATMKAIDSESSDKQQPVQVADALARLVHLLSKPGAFTRIDAILGENVIDESAGSCPLGEEGLECRRAEARRSLDCPRGDCYCESCAAAGPHRWESCCRESLRCCSHLAAACRNCDQPALHSFCSKHFNKCSRSER